MKEDLMENIAFSEQFVNSQKLQFIAGPFLEKWSQTCSSKFFKRRIQKSHFSYFADFRPKNGTKESLKEYRRAVKIGEEHGDCWSFYPDCPISIFNVIPDVDTTEDKIEVIFDGFDSGAKYSQNDEEEIFNLIKEEMKLSQQNIHVTT